MAAVWMRVRSDARTRWSAWLALALVLGVVGGAGIAAAAGARRTETAYPRFVARNRGIDVILGGFGGSDDPAVRARVTRALTSLPQVADYDRGPSFQISDRVILRPSGETISFPEIYVGGEANTEFRRLNIPKVVRGRLFHVDAPDEAVVEFTVADRLGLRVGQSMDVPLTEPDSGKEVLRTVHLVGILASPWDLPAVGQVSLGGMTLSPGFVRANARLIQPNSDAPSVRLKHGAADIPSFIRSVQKLNAEVDVPATLPQHLAGVRKTLQFEVTALWMLAGLIGLATLAIVGQALGRQAVLDAGEFASLRALAMSREQLFVVGMIRAAAIGLAGAAVAVVVAVLASPIFPRGLAGVVEPDPGFSADWLTLGVGAVATLAIALLVSAIPAWRTARVASNAPEQRVSTVARRLASAGAGPSVVSGVRLALEPGRGARALPVRSTILGISVALAAFWAAASFTQSLNHLIHASNLQGYAWDAVVQGPSEKAMGGILRRDPDVVAAVPGGATNIVIRGERLIPFTYEPGPISPVIVEGRAPKSDDEIALGTRVLRRFHKRIGDTVAVALDTNDPSLAARRLPFRIVGTTVVPPFFFEQVEPGHGSAITLDGYFRLDPAARERRVQEGGLPFIIRYRRGVDLRAKLAELRKQLDFIFAIQLRQPRAELDGVARSSGLPYTLTEILLFMAAATLVHALVSSVRKRRYDLAILKTLGFSRGQVRSAVAWQATTFAVLALAIGLPVGTVLGRWAWGWFVGSIGLVRFTITPPPTVVAIVVVNTLLLANAIAFLPGRSAARTQPAQILRAE